MLHYIILHYSYPLSLERPVFKHEESGERSQKPFRDLLRECCGETQYGNTYMHLYMHAPVISMWITGAVCSLCGRTEQQQ